VPDKQSLMALIQIFLLIFAEEFLFNLHLLSIQSISISLINLTGVAVMHFIIFSSL
jgi:hypothetical protein